ncbi:MAG TPA: tetratricopeptide repeat protein [Anaerolineae bacterium]|nr:tetratricopeptide repeat protein [Anaerolineae bacterium]
MKPEHGEEQTMRSTRLSVLCDGLIEAGWLLAVITIPLFFNAYSHRNIEPDKLAVLRSIVGVMIAAWLIQRSDRAPASGAQATVLLRTPLVLPALLFVAATLFSTLASVAPRLSLLGEYVRPEGAQTTLAYVSVFFLIVQRLRTHRQLERLLSAVVLTSVAVALYGLIQHFQLDPLVWSTDMAARAGASLGNPIFMAAYLIMALCLTLGLLVHRLRAWRVQRSTVAAIAITSLALAAGLQLAAIVISGSRGPWIGGMAGLFVFALMAALALKRQRLALSIVGFALLGATFIALLNLPNTPLEPLRSLPAIGQLGQLFEGESGTGKVRTLIWQGDAQLMLNGAPVQLPDGTPDPLHAIRPFVGYGPDTLHLVFQQVRPPELVALSGDVLTTRSHNETWDVLVTTGWLGVAVYQVLMACLLLYGLRWMGLLPDRRWRNTFIGLWLGAGIAAGLIALVPSQAKYLGLALSLGNVAGLAAYLVLLRVTGRWHAASALTADVMLIVGLLAAILAHYVEIQFGHAVASTRILFWVFAGLVVVIGTRRVKFDAPQRIAEPTSSVLARWSGVAGNAFSVAAVLATLLHNFSVLNPGTSDPVSILWQSLISVPARNGAAPVVLGLLLITLGFALVLFAPGLSQSDATRHPLRAALAVLGLLALSTGMAFGLMRAIQLGQLANVADPISLAERIPPLFDGYVIGLGAWALLLALAFATESTRTLIARPTRRLALIAVAPIALVVGVWINAANLNPIRADMVYKLGRDFDHNVDSAIVLYQRAIRLSPYQDSYYPALANALVYRAGSVAADTASGTGAGFALDDVLALTPAHIDGLNRSAVLVAAQTVFLRALDLNPLNPDHSLNLARFYLPGLPIDSATKAQLVERADTYYAQTARLKPTNVALWNEWADFDLRYRSDPAAAVTKLEQALTLDAQHPATYVNLGKAYTALADLDRASAILQQALVQWPDLAEAHSALAFAYYKQGRLDAAIRSYLRFVELTPDAPNAWEAHKNIALLRAQLGHTAEAIDAAQLALKLAPSEVQPELTALIDRLRAQLDQL